MKQMLVFPGSWQGQTRESTSAATHIISLPIYAKYFFTTNKCFLMRVQADLK
jgi:hypothetical protein